MSEEASHKSDNSHESRGPSTRLLVRIREGDDQEAWREFVQRYERRLVGFFRSYGLREEDAKDLMQEVFMSIDRHRLRFNERKGRAQSWVFRIAKNKLTDLWRKWSRSPEFESLSWADIEAKFSEFNFDEVLLEALENTRENLRGKKNAERDYRMFRRFYFENITLEELGLAENEKPGLVGVVCWRVKNTFEQEVQKLVGEIT